MDQPLNHKTIAEIGVIPAEGERERVRADLLGVKLDRGTELVVEHDGRRAHVWAELDADGIDVLHPFPAPKPLGLSLEAIGEHLDVRELDGVRPRGIETSFLPSKAARTHQLRPTEGEDRDQGGTIFDTDDRYLFQDNNFPVGAAFNYAVWRIVGKVRTAGGWGSGTVIGPRHVLTASHVVNWNADGRGNVGWISFTPSYFDGRGRWGEIGVQEVVFWEQAPGTLTDPETALDYVVLVTEQRIGDSIGYAGFRTYDDDWNGGDFWQYTGYPGELASGERPAFQGDAVISTKQDFTVNGVDGSVLGHFNEFTPGQSGGSVWGWWADEPWPRVVGVGSTIGSTAVQSPTGSTTGDNEYGGGPGLSSIISWARANRP